MTAFDSASVAEEQDANHFSVGTSPSNAKCRSGPAIHAHWYCRAKEGASHAESVVSLQACQSTRCVDNYLPTNTTGIRLRLS